jgi:hypothetical protein
MLEIPATQEVEIRGSLFEASLGQNIRETVSQKTSKNKSAVAYTCNPSCLEAEVPEKSLRLCLKTEASSGRAAKS